MEKKQNLGLFLASYDIGTGLDGAIGFQLTMSVFTPEKTVNGSGAITQAINPPVNVNTKFNGTFDYLSVMGGESIFVKATGYPVINWPAHGGIGPVIMPNLELTLVLDADWQTGTANYKYRTGVFDGLDDWIEVSNVPVKAISSSQLEAAA